MSLEEPDTLATNPAAGYSADVQIELFVNGQRFSVGQIGRGMLIFDEPVALPDTQGQLVLTIDGHPRKWAVTFPLAAAPSRIVHASFAWSTTQLPSALRLRLEGSARRSQISSQPLKTGH